MSTMKTKATSKVETILRKDFVAFMRYMFKRFGLPSPTPFQCLMADILQRDTSKRIVILAYRGFAKTTIANLYLVWKLWNDPTRQQAVWGQNETFASKSVNQMLNWVKGMSLFAGIAPRPDQKQSSEGFDTRQKPFHVHGASVNALSIGGGITGSRADDLLVDDPETSQNGYTQQRRENLDRGMAEAVQVIKQGTGRIIVLGTPHFDRSLHTRLKAKGYKVWILPVCVPPKEVADICWEHYPKQVRELIMKLPEWSPLDRFNEEEIQMRLSEGRVSFERQNLCNIYRSSATQQPLHLSRIILYDANTRTLPIAFEHAREPQYVAQDMAEFSCADIGEHFYRPFRVSETVKPYDEKIVYIDPAGGGKDECVLFSGGSANGYGVIFKCEGLPGGVTRENVEKIIDHAVSIQATTIYWESNINGGAEFCRAVLDEKYAPRFGRDKLPQVVPVHQNTNKMLRIRQTLESVINTGRIIITPDALTGDYLSAQDSGVESFADFTLTSQISNFNEFTPLPFDDRIDAFAGFVSKIMHHLGVTPAKQATDAEYERFKEYLERPLVPGADVTVTLADTNVTDLNDARWRRGSTRRRRRNS